MAEETEVTTENVAADQFTPTPVQEEIIG